MTACRDPARLVRSRLGLAVALALASCRGATIPPVDRDGDGYAAPLDCDDGNPAVHAAVTAYPDADGDGYGAGAPVTLCVYGNVPAGYALAGGDCAPSDPAAWRTINLVDRDGDGRTARDTPICAGATIPMPYRDAASGNDCDDADARLYDWVVAYQDRDGDGIGAGPRSILCVAAAIPPGWSRRGGDTDDADPAVGLAFTDDDLARLLD